jgi:hypothetical protein
VYPAAHVSHSTRRSGSPRPPRAPSPLRALAAGESGALAPPELALTAGDGGSSGGTSPAPVSAHGRRGKTADAIAGRAATVAGGCFLCRVLQRGEKKKKKKKKKRGRKKRKKKKKKKKAAQAHASSSP